MALEILMGGTDGSGGKGFHDGGSWECSWVASLNKIHSLVL